MVKVLNDHPMNSVTHDNIASLLMLTLYMCCPEYRVIVSYEEIGKFKAQFQNRAGLSLVGLKDGLEVRLIDQATGRKLLAEDARFDPNSKQAKAMRAHAEAKQSVQSIIDRLTEARKKHGLNQQGALGKLFEEAATALCLLAWEPE